MDAEDRRNEHREQLLVLHHAATGSSPDQRHGARGTPAVPLAAGSSSGLLARSGLEP